MSSTYFEVAVSGEKRQARLAAVSKSWRSNDSVGAGIKWRILRMAGKKTKA